MKPWRLLILLTAALAAAPIPARSSEQPASAAKAAEATTKTQSGLVIQPYLQSPAPDGVTLLWRTAKPAESWVEYGLTEKLGQTQPGESAEPDAPRSLYRRARLAGLRAGTQYFYRVGCAQPGAKGAKNSYSPTYRFTLPAPSQERVTCCILNDIHNVYPSFKAVTPLLRRQAPDCVFFNGDFFNNPPSEDFVIKGLQTYNAGAQAASRPVFYLRGNHDARGAYGPTLPRHFENPGRKLYFAWTLGPVRFIALDCGEEKESESYKQAQDAWLKQELASAPFRGARYRIVLHHIPIYGEMFNPSYKERWDPLFKNAPIDAAISAHIHMPQIIRPADSNAPHPVVIGGGRTNPTVIVVRADRKACRIELFDKNEKKMDEIEIKRD